MVTVKAVLLSICITGLVLASPATELQKRRGDWVVGFYKDQCRHAVDPGRVGGHGERGCSRVSGADCMNGSTGQGSGWHICGYHGDNCDGWNTNLGPMAGGGHAIIYENGDVQSINSWKVVRPGQSC